MDNKCVICHDEYNAKKLPFQLECTHTFCKFCILDTFKRDSRCPLCREEYTLIIKNKKEFDKKIKDGVPKYIKRALCIVPVTNNINDPIRQIELLTYRIFIRLHKISTIIFQPCILIHFSDEKYIHINIYFISIFVFCILIYIYSF